MDRAELSGGYAEQGPERPAERLVRLVPGVQRELDDRPIAHLQLPGGPFEPQPADVLADRLAHHAAKDAVKMKRREVGHARQFLQRQVLVQVPLNVDQHPQDAFPVAAFR